MFCSFVCLLDLLDRSREEAGSSGINIAASESYIPRGLQVGLSKKELLVLENCLEEAPLSHAE